VTRRRGIVLSSISALLIGPWLALWVWSLALELPSELAARPGGVSTRILDRDGNLVRHARGEGGTLGLPVRLEDVSPDVVRALLAAEDRRFRAHPGVDPIAMLRAATSAIRERRLVSGASTITQQLARTVRPRPRTLLGKLSEMALALRIERSLSKDRILEEYLSRAPFGPGVAGVEAASRAYLGKSAADVSLAEAALLVSLPRGPSLYDPARHLDRAVLRRDRVLGRMEVMGTATSDEVRRGRSEAVAMAFSGRGPLAPHFVRAVRGGPLGPAGASEIRTTLDADLQREAETLVARTTSDLSAHQVTAAAAIVLENETGEVLAYVGSPGDDAVLGWNDGVLAFRQPGSTLKPFVYELAMERLAMSPATVLPDVPLSLPGPHGDFRPENYDGRFHGPVPMREALGSSYNVPAVWTAARLGPATVLDRLHALGFATLTESAETYGAAIALGDGEVRLVDLATAYATLARGGSFVPARAVRSYRDALGEHEVPLASPVPVLDPVRAGLVTRALSDDRARIAAFGAGSVLAFDVPVAAKTGTSKGFRDNLAVGYTREITVAVWVGNFDGSPMAGVSGVAGAGPLLHDLVVAAVRRRPSMATLVDDVGTEVVSVCPLSGHRATAACPHHRAERVVPGSIGDAPCEVHVRARVDLDDGLLAGPDCHDRVTERVFEDHHARFRAWAEAAGRPLLPRAASPRCPRGVTVGHGGDLRVSFPTDGAVFVRDGALGDRREQIAIRIAAPSGARDLRVVVDGVAHSPEGSRLLWALAPGDHSVVAEAGGVRSDPVAFRVE
jgi:penicillin-binding protein 1C